MEHLKNPFVIIAILFVLGFSFVGWRYTESINEKNSIERERIESAERLKAEELSQDTSKIRASFIAPCTIKFETMEEKLRTGSLTLIDLLKNAAEGRCKRGDYFDLESVWFCENGISYAHNEESYVSRCIDWKMSQI